MPYNTYFPEYQKFKAIASAADLVPVYRKIVADLDTPLTIFAKVDDDHEHIFLFESMEGGEKWGRYSFIGFDPLLKFSSNGNRISSEYVDEGLRKEYRDVNPLEVLRDIIEGFNAFESEDLPRFCGGAVGFLGYDMVRFMEELPDRHRPLDLPDCSFIVPRIVLVHDSFKQTVTVVCWTHSHAEGKTEIVYDRAVKKIDSVIERIQGPVPEKYFSLNSRNGNKAVHEFTSNMLPQNFHQMVEAAREYILAGDIFQVVLSQRFHTKTDLSPLQIYRALRHINPSPYLFFLKLGDLIQIGSSPEILVRKDGSSIELRPIAGTRKRGESVEEDEALEKELLADPKELAEHLMLVDLGRNDVGRVAAAGSVEVRNLAVIERYSHVMHIVSGVHGTIAEGKDQFDVLTACFPAGTVSGAPKIRAMEIIDELEPTRRGAYAGSVGYFGFSGNMDFCITIRTFVMQGKDLWIQAGAGIVADSDPEREFEETVNKSMGLRKAVELAEKGL
ncbi:anthranilate synthase component I [Desulfopila inferna]|uniref:anthranilate synthase component I n=1 Tax=Desulfopila inferna TaxID=468528 RepID=UPI0019640167|nr:anthranilate synthase component I [Desulfopila inferna]MBM9602642.1 anthranilate synthase component I [Desulfopila inferna]